MRKVLAVLLVILLGIALGVGVATWRLKASPWNPTPDQGGQEMRPSSSEGGNAASQFARLPCPRRLTCFAAVA
jgi:hypothetical protein